MANQEHVAIFKQGVKNWNAWREQNPRTKPDLSEIDLRGCNLHGADLRGVDFHKSDLYMSKLMAADFRGANLIEAELGEAALVGGKFRGADLYKAELRNALLYTADLSEARLQSANLDSANLMGAKLAGADLENAILAGANLIDANLIGTNLRNASLMGTNLNGADFTNAKLNGADLAMTSMVLTNFENANLTGCRIYGIAAWNVNLKGAKQSNLVISETGDPTITVDNLEIAQFLYLLLNNERIRDVINTLTTKVVLILGSFKEERKAVLDEIREALRHHNYLPILFDFEKPSNRDITETISILAHMSRFIIADITDARSIPQELQRIIPDLPSVPVQPLLLASAREYGMFEHFKRYPWVLETYLYHNKDEVIASLEEKIIAPAEQKAMQLWNHKNSNA